MEILRAIANSSGREKTILLTDLKMRERMQDIRKVVSMCEALIYYYEKIDKE